VNILTAQILFFGVLVLAFGGFASFMADRQTQRKKRGSIEPPRLL
jgi:hypothetical protein